MHIVYYTNRDGHAAEAASGDAVWDALVEVAESGNRSLVEICMHIEAARMETGFVESLETFLYHYYRTRNPPAFGGMSDGDETDSRFERGLRGVGRDGSLD